MRVVQAEKIKNKAASGNAVHTASVTARWIAWLLVTDGAWTRRAPSYQFIISPSKSGLCLAHEAGGSRSEGVFVSRNVQYSTVITACSNHISAAGIVRSDWPCIPTCVLCGRPNEKLRSQEILLCFLHVVK